MARVLDVTHPTHCLLPYYPVVRFQAPNDMDDIIVIGAVSSFGESYCSVYQGNYLYCWMECSFYLGEAHLYVAFHYSCVLFGWIRIIL